MKMKRLFMTLAAMLLVSLGAFAQNGATLKGDTNGDGKVDVEDVTSVVDLILSGKTYGYFYFGTTQPTADNYQTLSGVVASYTSIGEAVGATASIDAGQTLYMLCPVAWMNGESVKVEYKSGETVGFSEDVDAATIPGYAIYRTQVWNEATDVTLKTQRNNYYLGETDQETFTVSDLTEYKSEKPTYIEAHASYGNTVTVWIYPAEWGEPVAMMNLGDNDKSAWTWNPDWLTVPEGYTGAWNQAGDTAPYDIIWNWPTPPNNYYFGETDRKVFTKADLTEYKSEKSTSLTAHKSTGDVCTVWIYPAMWGEPTEMLNGGENDKSAWTWNPDGLTVPEGYVGAWLQAGATTSFDLEWDDDSRPRNYYLGETDKEVFTTTDLTEYKYEKPTDITIHGSTGNTVTVWIYPAEWGKPKMDNSGGAWTWAPNEWLTVPEGYIGAYTQAGATTTIHLTWDN